MSQIVFHSLNAQMNSLLLDLAPGPSVAFSLRKLNSAYSGPAIRVRRSSDNSESDIGFDAYGNFDAAAFSTFVSGSNGYIKKWYDQGGNANDATQTSASNQPQLVLNASGTFAGVLFTGSSSQRLMLNSTVTLTTGISNLNVVKKVSTSNIMEMLGNTTNNNVYSEYWSNGLAEFSMASSNSSNGYSIYPSSNTNNTNLNLIGAFGDASSGLITYKQTYFNIAVTTSSVSGSQPKSTYDCLGYGDGSYCTGNVFEVLLWPGSNSNEAIIVNNIKAYYSI